MSSTPRQAPTHRATSMSGPYRQMNMGTSHADVTPCLFRRNGSRKSIWAVTARMRAAANTSSHCQPPCSTASSATTT